MAEAGGRSARRPPLWLVVLATALLSAGLTLGLDRGLQLLATEATPTAAPRPTEGPPVVVVIETTAPLPLPSALPGDEQAALLEAMQRAATRQLGYIFVQKAERQISFALEALSRNESARADRELAEARASLDEAFQLLPEDLKPQIDAERLEIGRIRADLEINPRGLDEDLRRMRDRLLSLISRQ